MWWNGWVFSFEKAPSKLTNSEESSGMDEAVECLDDFDMQVPTNQQERGWQEEDFIERFDSLQVAMTVTVHQESNLSSSGSGVPQTASVSSIAPGPLHTHSVEQQDMIIPDNSQPIEEFPVRSRNRKGKEKAVDISEADVQVKKAGKQTRRGRPNKKMAI